jgi:HSP20 family protein
MLSFYRRSDYCNNSFEETNFMLPLAQIPKSAHCKTHDQRTHSWEPAVEIFENASQFIVEVELPGIDPEFVDIDISDLSIMIQSIPCGGLDRESRNISIDPGFITFTRYIALPAPVEKDALKSSHANGVLTLHLPKSTPSIPKSIKILFEN